MPGKVLKIDVVVDENGTARRALSDLEGGVKKVETSATTLASPLGDIEKKLAAWDDKIDALEGSINSLEGAAGAGAESLVSMSLGLAGVLTVAGTAGAAIYALGSYVKDATEYYIEQSGVLDINKEAVDGLKATWDALKYSVGEVVVGGQGDFRSWINVVNAGLIEMVTHLEAGVMFYRELAQFAKDVNPLSSFSPGSPPGIDTTVRNPDGSLTPYGQLLEQQKKQPKGDYQFGGLHGESYSGAEAERITNEEIAKQKREQLELERQQKAEAAERLRLSNEQAKLENDLTDAIMRSKAAYEKEIESAETLNRKTKERVDLQLRDGFLKDTLSGGDYSQNKIQEDYQRKAAAVDPRASNAAELLRSYQAEKEFALIQLRQASEGFTQGISDDLNHFRAEYADVIGQLPTQFEAVIPPVIAASGALRDGLTTDLGAISDAVGGAGQSFQLLGGNINATYDEIAEGLKRADDAYKKAGFFQYNDLGVMMLREQQTGGKLVGYGGGGVVEPRYMAAGGPAGIDTVPAFLAPGEGVLSRTGMAALDRLNAGGSFGGGRGVHIEKGAITIDARGAQFADDRALDALADRLQQKLALLQLRAGV